MACLGSPIPFVAGLVKKCHFVCAKSRDLDLELHRQRYSTLSTVRILLRTYVDFGVTRRGVAADDVGVAEARQTTKIQVQANVADIHIAYYSSTSTETSEQ